LRIFHGFVAAVAQFDSKYTLSQSAPQDTFYQVGDVNLQVGFESSLEMAVQYSG
jgi:hypothetical protein